MRIRPPSFKEHEDGVCCLHTSPETMTLVTSPENCHYTYDHVAGPTGTQEQLFKVVGRPIVDNVIEGYNSTIFVSRRRAAVPGATVDTDKHRLFLLQQA